ncbi:hypothetical protein HKX48_005899 [Thoreauomyces humboldtii]|nr:hypothetical protein HKX48_005899 [Thoreauomyces humboldtii]
MSVPVKASTPSLRLVFYIRAVIGHGLAKLRRFLLFVIRLVSPSSSSAFRVGDASVSPQWLTSLLRRRGSIGPRTRVETVSLAPLTGNRGMGGVMRLVTITYGSTQNSVTLTDAAAGTDKTTQGPVTLLLKTSPDSMTGRRTCLFGGREREAWFHQSRFKGSVQTPLVYHAYGSRWFGEYVLLMEDLREREDAVGTNMLFGNQIWGIPEATRKALPKWSLTDPVGSQVALLRNVYLQMAEQHARWWNHPSLLTETWLKGASWYGGRDRASWELGIDRARRDWTTFKNKSSISDGNDHEEVDAWLSPKLVGIIDRSLASASWSRMQTSLHRSPFTLCHGDLHASNMHTSFPLSSPFNATTSSQIFYDWSEVGPWEPTADLAQMLISDVHPTITAAHSRSLVIDYWTRLTTHPTHPVSSAAYPFEACWDAFCDGGPARWIWLFAVMAQWVSEDCGRFFQDQLLRFIEAHGDKDAYLLKPIVCLL